MRLWAVRYLRMTEYAPRRLHRSRARVGQLTITVLRCRTGNGGAIRRGMGKTLSGLPAAVHLRAILADSARAATATVYNQDLPKAPQSVAHLPLEERLARAIMQQTSETSDAQMPPADSSLALTAGEPPAAGTVPTPMEVDRSAASPAAARHVHAYPEDSVHATGGSFVILAGADINRTGAVHELALAPETARTQAVDEPESAPQSLPEAGATASPDSAAPDGGAA